MSRRCIFYVLAFAVLIALYWAMILCTVAFSPLHIAEDDAGWIPALYGNGQGHSDPFHPFPSLERPHGSRDR